MTGKIPKRLQIITEQDAESGEPIAVWKRYNISFRLYEALILKQQLESAIYAMTGLQDAVLLMTQPVIEKNCAGPTDEQRGRQV